MTTAIVLYHAPDESLDDVYAAIDRLPSSWKTLDPSTTVRWRSRDGIPVGLALATITDSDAALPG